MDGILNLLKIYISLKEVAKFYEMKVFFSAAESLQCELSVIGLDKKDVETTIRFSVRTLWANQRQENAASVV